MPSSTSSVWFSNTSSISVRATAPAIRTRTECAASVTAPARSPSCPGFFALSSPSPRGPALASDFPNVSSLQASDSPNDSEKLTNGGAPGASRADSPAFTRTLRFSASDSVTLPRATSTDAIASSARSANFVPCTASAPRGSSMRASSAACVTSAVSAPRTKRARRGPSSSSASSVERSSVTMLPSERRTRARVRASVLSSAAVGNSPP